MKNPKYYNDKMQLPWFDKHTFLDYLRQNAEIKENRENKKVY